MRKHKNSALYKAHTAKIILLVMILVGSISMVSAFEFDNVISNYDKNTQIVTIENAFGLGKKLADIQLISNSPACTECSAEGKLILYNYGKLMDNLEFELGEVESYKILIKIGERDDYDITYG